MSRVTSRKRRAGNAGEPTPGLLKFINLTANTHSKKYLTQVRSHVTFRQHYRQRQKDHTEEQELRIIQELQGDYNAVNVKKDTVNITDEVKEERDGELHGLGDEEVDEVIARDTVDVQYPAESVSSSVLSKTAQSALESAYSLGTIAFQLFVLDDPANTVGIACNHLSTDAASIVKLYDFIVYVQAGDISKQYATGTHRSVAHKRFMSFVFDEPITLILSMLIGLRCFLAPFGQPISDEDHTQILSVKGFLIRSINIALQDERRRISNQMLVCISLLASYEVKYESPERSNYHLHMRGLVQMINLRGGLRAIGLQTPWVERLLIWNDINSSAIAGCDPYCAGIDPHSTLRRPQANPEIFTTRKR